MLSKILLAAAVALVAVLAASVLVFAATHAPAPPKPTGPQIAIYECKSAYCNKGTCRAVAKIQSGRCNAAHFRHGQSFKTDVINMRPGLCVYEAVYSLNSTSPTQSCVPKNLKGLFNRVCGACVLGHGGTYSQMVGCNSSTTLAIKYGCDKTCTTCKATHKVAEKTCIVPPHMNITVAFGVPKRCPTKAILSQHWNTSSDCEGHAMGMGRKTLADSCYSRGASRWGGVRSHYYHVL